MLSSARKTLTMSKTALNQFFSKKWKFDHEAVVSCNDNINFWNPRAFLHRKRLVQHTLPIDQAGLKLPTFGTRLYHVQTQLKCDHNGRPKLLALACSRSQSH